jgi:hypothetical protein
MPTPDTFIDSLERYCSACEEDYHPEDYDRDELARLLVAIRDVRAAFAAFADRVESDLLIESGDKSWVVDGLGEVEIKRSIRRTGWRYDELVPIVVARVADEPGVLFDPETGERVPWTESAHRIAARLRECFSFSAKVTGLRAIGIQPDEFCTEDEAAWSVRLPRSA